MRNDLKSNFNFLEVYAAQAISAGDEVSSAVDVAAYGRSITFMMSLGTIATSFAAKLQHSDTLATGYTDEVTGLGNDTSVTMSTPADSGELHVVNPREQYYRVWMTAGGACVGSVYAAAGPKDRVTPADGVIS